VHDSPAPKADALQFIAKIFSKTCTTILCIHWLHWIMATKDVGLRIRVERGLRDDFLEACRLLDKPAAQVIREFMRSYVAQHDVEKRPRRNLKVRNRVRAHVSEP
jgi:hypothetical protein